MTRIHRDLRVQDHGEVHTVTLEVQADGVTWDVTYRGERIGTIEKLPDRGGWAIPGQTYVLLGKERPYPAQGTRNEALRLLVSWHRRKATP